MLQRRGALDRNSHLFLESKYLKAGASKLEMIEISAEKARTSGHISDKPLIVLTSGKNSGQELSSGLTKEEFDGGSARSQRIHKSKNITVLTVIGLLMEGLTSRPHPRAGLTWD